MKHVFRNYSILRLLEILYSYNNDVNLVVIYLLFLIKDFQYIPLLNGSFYVRKKGNILTYLSILNIQRMFALFLIRLKEARRNQLGNH